MNASKKSGKKSVTAKQTASQKKTTKPAKAVQSKKGGKSLFERFTGLTLAEFLKLKKLKKTLSGDNGQSGKQISTQQTITFDKMYQDGICKVRKNYYTKMIEFYDLNYVLLDEEERADILGLYSQLINYFDPTISFQIFLFNRHVNEETLAAQFEISPQGDKFDDIREEFSDMLKSLSAKGNNGVIKSKYIIFGIEAENIKEARQRFISLEADIIKNLKNLGTNAKCLDGKERLRVLYEFFNQDKMEPFRFSFKEMAESGNTVKDYIAPQGFEFRFPGRYKMGHMFGATKYLDIISPKLNDELLKRLLDIDSNISISIHMRTIEPTEAIKLLKRALSDVQKTKIDEQKKAVRAGYDMDILPTDIVLYEKNTMELLDDLNTSNQKLIWTTILISSFGRNKKELESVSQRVSGIIQQANCRLIDLQYKQEVAMNAAAPIGINETKEGRHLITKNLAILVPFNTQELFQSGQSLYYGLNALSNNMIMADRKKLRTPNGVILGTPGSGKSFSAKREILGSFLVSRDDILICDPEGEYYPLVKALGGEVVKLATNSKDYLNPMDIQLSHKNDREALKLKSDFLITLCDAIAGGETGLANDEKGIIDRCIEGIYDEYFKDPRPENMPILEDLYNALVKYEPDKAVSEELAIDAKQKAVRIANSLVLYVHGSQNYFNHRTNVDSQNRIVCFDIRDLGKQLKELGMLIVQDAVWNRVSRNRERRVATRYYCDEFHLLLRDKQTAQYSVEIWKRFRKWGGIPTGLTQNVGDFLRSEEIEGILGNSDFVYLLNQNAKDQVILADKLGLSEKQLQYVTNSESGCGLILFNDVVIPFADRYPTDTKTYAIMNTRPQEEEEHSRSIKCFDTSKPTLNAAVSDGLLTIQASDNDSGVKVIYVNGYEFTDVTNGTVNIRLSQFDAGYEYFTITAMDNAGNVSEVYKTKNPYYKDPNSDDDSNPAEQLPASAEATKPSSATATVTDHTTTDSNGNTTSTTTSTNSSPEAQKKAEFAKADAEEAALSDGENGEDMNLGKEFYTIEAASGKVFYLIIDRDGQEEMVYFLTEITENDLLNVTTDNSETLPKNSAALESQIPVTESA